MSYTLVKTPIPDLHILEPKVFLDERGFFFESFNACDFSKATGTNVSFVQDGHSKSIKGVLRGLHYQVNRPQGKLVRLARGAVFDVAVDIRPTSAQFGKWFGLELSAENKRQLWVPPGFAHGSLTLSDEADFLYKVTDYYAPEDERSLLWSDKTVGVEWPISVPPILSGKDQAGISWQEMCHEISEAR